jgi:hypothetical protein
MIGRDLLGDALQFTSNRREPLQKTPTNSPSTAAAVQLVEFPRQFYSQ